jgi:D-alanyl-D-alanine carboxypeptidase
MESIMSGQQHRYMKRERGTFSMSLLAVGAFATFASALTPVAASARPAKQANAIDLAPKLRTVLTEHQRVNPKIAGEAVTVITSRGSWSAATGKVVGSKAPLTDRHVFRIASLTKPFTAAAVLRLMEAGQIDLHKPIEIYISPDASAQLRKGGYDPAAINVAHLLSHTSGIYDYATDEKFMEAVGSNPAKAWTRAEQIQFAVDHGKSYGKPGEAYGYSDTGYVLLGEIIERRTGKPLGLAVRTLLNYQRLGLVDTYWEGYERPASSAPFTGALFETLDMTEANHSFDQFGGGGLVSSTRDLARFFRALVRGEVFTDRRTLAVLLTVPGAKQDGGSIEGNGLMNVKIGRATCLGHSGFWGQLAAYCPTADIAFAWTRNSSIESAPGASFRDGLARIVGLD